MIAWGMFVVLLAQGAPPVEPAPQALLEWWDDHREVVEAGEALDPEWVDFAGLSRQVRLTLPMPITGAVAGFTLRRAAAEELASLVTRELGADPGPPSWSRWRPPIAAEPGHLWLRGRTGARDRSWNLRLDLSPSGDTWRLVDAEAGNVGLPWSVETGMRLLERGIAEAPPHAVAAVAALTALRAEDTERARFLAAADGPTELPLILRATRSLARGQIAWTDDKPKLAAKRLAAAAADAPSIGVASYLEAMALLHSGSEEAALAALDRVETQVGVSTRTLVRRGEALLGLKRFREAAETARRALDLAPANEDALILLGQALPVAKKDQLAPPFLAERGDAPARFERLAEAFLKRKDADALLALATARLTRLAGDPDAEFFAAEAEMQLGRHAECAARCVALLPWGDFESFTRYDQTVELLIDALREQDKPLEALAVVNDDGRTFRLLAAALLDDHDGPTLAELIDRHRKGWPNDPWLLYYEGERLLMEEQKDAARDIWKKGLDAKSRAVHDACRDALADLHAERGEHLQALAELPDHDATYARLADDLVEAKEADTLERLNELRRRDAPHDPKLAMFAAEVLYLREDYRRAATALRAAAEVAGEEDQTTIADRLIRCLLRSGELAEARREAAAYRRFRDDEAFYPTLVHAFAGDVEATAAGLADCLDQGFESGDLAADPDLGKLLLQPKFDAVRRKYLEGSDP